MTIKHKIVFTLIAVGLYTWAIDRIGGTNVRSLVEAGGAFLTTITLSVLLAFRTNSAYDRWWEARKMWGDLTNHIRNLAIKADVFLATAVTRKQELADGLSSFPATLRDHLRQLRAGDRQPPPRNSHLPVVSAKNLLTLINRSREEGLIDGFQQMQLDVHARALMDICGGCERIRLTPMPPAYRAIFRGGILLNLLAMPWFIVPEFHAWSIPVVEVLGLLLVGMELIAEEIEDPFGIGANKLPLDSICRSIQNSVAQIFESQATTVF